MFGGPAASSSLGRSESDAKLSGESPSSPEPKAGAPAAPLAGGTARKSSTGQVASGEKRSGNGGLPARQDTGGSSDKKRRSSGVGGKASSFLASAKSSLSFSQGSSSGGGGGGARSSIAEEGGAAPSKAPRTAKQGLPAPPSAGTQHNNSAGEESAGPRSTFRVGVWEDKNRKCRRTMEDTHAYLYNFLAPPSSDAAARGGGGVDHQAGDSCGGPAETDNGYFAIFDGHAGTFAADWCGKKLHLLLEDVIRKNPNHPIPELLDQAFTSADSQLEKLPLKNSGCTAAVAVLRWEDRPPGAAAAQGGAPGLQPVALTVAAAATTPLKNAESSNPDTATAAAAGGAKTDAVAAVAVAAATSPEPAGASARIKSGTSSRSRVLYTANVGDARIILCRAGRALRLSYDHKGSDENEGRRVANAGGLILNNRVNGVLAVTRALGDAYMKDLVTGHPYTTETVIQPDTDEFIIIACDGLWDVCSDQEAVDLVREVEDPSAGAKMLVDHALSRFSTDNLSCMVVRLHREGRPEAARGGDRAEAAAAAGEKPAASDRGAAAEGDGGFKPTALDSTAEEEVGSAEGNDGEGAREAEGGKGGASAPLDTKEDKAK